MGEILENMIFRGIIRKNKPMHKLITLGCLIMWVTGMHAQEIKAGKYQAIFTSAVSMHRSEFRGKCQTSDTALLRAFILEENRYEFRSCVPGGEYILCGTPDLDYFEVAYYTDGSVLMRERFYMDGTRIPEYSIGKWFRSRDDLDRFLRDIFAIVIS